MSDGRKIRHAQKIAISDIAPCRLFYDGRSDPGKEYLGGTGRLDLKELAATNKDRAAGEKYASRVATTYGLGCA
jgi:hypothetical protein